MSGKLLLYMGFFLGIPCSKWGNIVQLSCFNVSGKLVLVVYVGPVRLKPPSHERQGSRHGSLVKTHGPKSFQSSTSACSISWLYYREKTWDELFLTPEHLGLAPDPWPAGAALLLSFDDNNCTLYMYWTGLFQRIRVASGSVCPRVPTCTQDPLGVLQAGLCLCLGRPLFFGGSCFLTIRQSKRRGFPIFASSNCVYVFLFCLFHEISNFHVEEVITRKGWRINNHNTLHIVFKQHGASTP